MKGKEWRKLSSNEIMNLILYDEIFGDGTYAAMFRPGFAPKISTYKFTRRI